jgi:uncharacterized protein YifE (UPF0438 family)
MSVEMFLNKLRGKERAHQDTLQERWRKLVASIADGKPEKEEDAFALCQKLGKTAEDLAAAAALFTKRRQAKMLLDRGKLAPAERDRTFAAIAAAEKQYQADLDALTKKYQAAKLPMEQRMRKLDEEIHQGEQGERVLRDTAVTDPEDEAQLSRLKAELEEARRSENEPAQAAHKAARLAADEEHDAAFKQDPDHTLAGQRWPRADVERHELAAKAHREEAADQLARAAPHAAIRAELEKRVAALESAIQAKVLEP